MTHMYGGGWGSGGPDGRSRDERSLGHSMGSNPSPVGSGGGTANGGSAPARGPPPPPPPKRHAQPQPTGSRLHLKNAGWGGPMGQLHAPPQGPPPPHLNNPHLAHHHLRNGPHPPPPHPHAQGGAPPPPHLNAPPPLVGHHNNGVHNPHHLDKQTASHAPNAPASDARDARGDTGPNSNGPNSNGLRRHLNGHLHHNVVGGPTAANSKGGRQQEDRPSSFSDKRVEFMLKCAALKDNEFKPGGSGGPTSTSPSPDPLDLIQRTNNGDLGPVQSGSGPGPHGPPGPHSRGARGYDRPLRAAQQSGPTNQNLRFTPSATRCLIKHNEMEAQLYEQGSGKVYPFRSPLDWSEHQTRGHHGRKMQKNMRNGHSGLGPPLSGSIYLGSTLGSGGFPTRGRTTH